MAFFLWAALFLSVATEKVQIQILWWEDQGAGSCSVKNRKMKMAKSEKGENFEELEMAWNNRCKEGQSEFATEM